MKEKNLIAHITATYRTLRLVLVFVGVLLPLVLWLGYGSKTGDWTLQNSMSAYYHAPVVTCDACKFTVKDSKDSEIAYYFEPKGVGAMRDWFVGALFVTGALLLAYKGFTKLENYALNLAGVLAALVALFPMAWPEGTGDSKFSVHGLCAVLFFLCIAYVCIFQASATLSLIKDDTRRRSYNRWYKGFGVAMVASPVIAFIAISLLGKKNQLIFFVEAIGVWVFAGYWWKKSLEIRETQADLEAAKGNLEAPQPEKLSDAFRQISISPVDDQQVDQ
jgi:hypothetical protein